MVHKFVVIVPGFDIMLPKLAVALVVLALVGDFLVGVVWAWLARRRSQ